MRKLVVFGNNGQASPFDPAETVTLDDVALRVALLDDDPPAFDPGDPGNARSVLVRIKAFSLNYRDKNRIFTTALKAPPDKYYALGSEFAAEVIGTGPEVTRFSPGDRVMGNNAYPDSGVPGLMAGVPTNHGSREVQIFHEAKLASVPGNMPYEEAAAFTIGAQTTYSMVRRLGLKEGSHVLVTSAKSNTSLFAINALRKCKAKVYATSTSGAFEDRLKNLGVAELAVVRNGEPFHANPVLKAVLERNQGFDGAIDPYFDLHFSRALDVMKMGGKYISCGVYDQYLELIGKTSPARASGGEFGKMMIRNLTVMGNCIGLEEDLAAACNDYAAGSLPVIVDSVFSDGDVAGFLDRTYRARDRFGKVVYRYD